MDALTLEHLHHAFGPTVALDDFSLSLAAGEFVCLLGPSGCGKTTALRVAAGLQQVQRGRVLIDGRLVAGEGVELPPEERGVGLVFQDYALFPHLDVVRNVAFGLKGRDRRARHERALEVLEQVGMAEQAEAYPHALSGGQQQRVALARALAPEPHVMLLDEPFSGLDSQLRNRIRDETLHVLKRSGAATLMVTHDPDEALFMADRIALMREGRLVQVGRPSELYFSPRDAFVAGFFGEVNAFPGVAQGGYVISPFGPIEAKDAADGTLVQVIIRPEAISLVPQGEGGPGNGPTARVMAARLLGRSSLVHLSVEGASEQYLHLHARVPGRFLPAENALLTVHLDHSQTFVFDLPPG